MFERNKNPHTMKITDIVGTNISEDQIKSYQDSFLLKHGGNKSLGKEEVELMQPILAITRIANISKDLKGIYSKVEKYWVKEQMGEFIENTLMLQPKNSSISGADKDGIKFETNDGKKYVVTLKWVASILGNNVGWSWKFVEDDKELQKLKSEMQKHKELEMFGFMEDGIRWEDPDFNIIDEWFYAFIFGYFLKGKGYILMKPEGYDYDMLMIIQSIKEVK